MRMATGQKHCFGGRLGISWARMVHKRCWELFSNFKHFHNNVNNLWLHVATRKKIFGCTKIPKYFSMKNQLNAVTWCISTALYVMLFYCGYIVCGYMTSSRKSDFDIAMGQYFCDVVMKHDYRLCVGYIHVVFFLLNDAYSQWRSKRYKSGGGHLLLGFWK